MRYSTSKRHAVLFAAGLGLSCYAQAADFTVGPAGSYRTMQAAVDAALATGGSHRVLVQRGNYAERFAANPCPLGPGTAFEGTLAILGGYDDTFSEENRVLHTSTIKDPLADGGHTVRLESNAACIEEDASGAVRAVLVSNAFVLDGFKFGGAATRIAAFAVGGKIAVTNNLFNRLSGEAGVDLVSSNHSPVLPGQVAFHGNVAFGNATSSRAFLIGRGSGSSELLVAANAFERNEALVDHLVELSSSSAAALTIADNAFEANIFPATAPNADLSVRQLVFSSGAAGKVLVERNRWTSVQHTGLMLVQSLEAYVTGSGMSHGRATIRNNLAHGVGSEGFSIEHFDPHGVAASASATPLSVDAINNTLIEVGGVAMRFSANPAAHIAVQNNVFWRNAADIDGISSSAATIDHNSLSSVDPLFMDADARNYCLQDRSSAVDAGTRAVDAGVVDLGFNPRISGASINQGAMECSN